MTTENILSRSLDGSLLTVRWLDDSSITADYPTPAGSVQVKHGHFVDGKSEGVEVVLVTTELVEAVILPSRGMGIWKLWSRGVEFGWTSPVDGPVHPSLVPVFDPGGLGWLEGFDELVVRCGLESNGAPEKNDSGTLCYPLHGRIANLPARDLRVEVDPNSGLVEIIGDVLETRLFFNRLRLRCRIGFRADSIIVQLIDEVTNERSMPATMQMLYHINIGNPVLGDGAIVELPIETLAPKDALAASEIDDWNHISAPEVGYAERVYFAKPLADDSGWSTALLRSAADTTGFGVRFDTRTLPYFVFWKNLAATSDGYVVGLEPATNLPNQRTFETKQGRIITLAPGETTTFCVNLHLLVGHDEVTRFRNSIEALSKTAISIICRAPKPGWSVL